MQTPSVGRIVHYVRKSDSRHIAAIIGEVHNEGGGAVSLTCFPSDREPHNSVAMYDARMSPGTWHYPEHVGTVQYHESEDDEASKREGPVSNSPEVE